MAVKLDLNNRQFQEDWFAFGKEERNAVLESCVKLSAMTWERIYRDAGFKWELIQSRRGDIGERIHSIRVTRRMRAVVQRAGDYLEFSSLHPDHDSAY